MGGRESVWPELQSRGTFRIKMHYWLHGVEVSSQDSDKEAAGTARSGRGRLVRGDGGGWVMLTRALASERPAVHDPHVACIHLANERGRFCC